MAHVVPIPSTVRTPATDLLSTVGNTPMLRLERIAREFPGVEICAKAEYFNPGGSVKDRPALNMILDGERSGRLNPSRIILDATSGNTGHRLCDDRRGARVPGQAVHARQRFDRAQAHSEGLRRGDALQRSGAKDPTAPSGSAARSTRRIPTPIFIPTSTAIRPTGRRISRPPARRSSSRPADASRISWRPWGPAARSWA